MMIGLSEVVGCGTTDVSMRVGRIEVCCIFYSFRYFEPVEFFENRSDVVVFWGFSNRTGESILNSLDAVYLGGVTDVYVEEERIVVVWFSVDYRFGDGRCSFEIEHRANSAKVAD